jgi:hypothetical protein
LSVRNIATTFNQHELANVAWSCAVFGIYPPDLMSILYNGLLGSGSERNPHTLTSLFGDDGIQLQHILIMIYVQAVLDLEAKHALPQDLSLPDDFPEAWYQSSTSSSSSLFSSSSSLTNPLPPAANTFEMNLTTSKIQRDISIAFTRVGFTHVEEHVITMDQLARDYGIRVPAKPMGVFAIDIANVQDKIAIEVDGPFHYISIIDDEPDDTSNVGHAKLVEGKLESPFGRIGTRKRINGSTALKERLLRGLGWQVLHVPYWEWNHLANDRAEEEAYCRRLLASLKQQQ